MTKLQPEYFGFIPFNIDGPGGLKFYEINSHVQPDGNLNKYRLSVYLSKDGDYVTVWNGLFDPFMTQCMMEGIGGVDRIKFNEQYYQDVFRGYIKTKEDAEVILFRALQLDKPHRPQQLSADEDNNLRCDWYPEQ